MPESLVLVAGGTGVLGRAAIPELLKAGHAVIATTRSPHKIDALRALGAVGVHLDAFDAPAARAIVRSWRPDAIVNLITDLGRGDLGSTARLRVLGTRHLVDAAVVVGVEHLVTASISWVYASGRSAAQESEGISIAGRSATEQVTLKAVAEMEAIACEVPRSRVLRFGQIYGEGTWYAPSGRYHQLALEGRLPATETLRSFLHIHDAGRAVAKALAWPSGTWNIVDNCPAPGTEWVPHFAASIGAPEPPVIVTGDVGRPVDNSSARLLGFRLEHPSWREILGG